MGLNSGIEWTTHTWNPWIGCTQLYEGCRNCYAKREMTRRGMDFNTVKRTSVQTWNQVKKYNAGDRVFVCSWSDFFHLHADRWRNDAWEAIKSRRDVTWLILTKRIEWVHPDSQFPKNVWLGVSASTKQDTEEQIGMLVMFDVAVRFVSFEPLLEDLGKMQLTSCPEDDTDLEEFGQYIDWIIIGCETLAGGKAGRFQDGFIEAARKIIKQCQEATLPVFVKQIPINGKVNRNPEQWPEDLRIQQYP